MELFSLQGQTAIITGGGRGLGAQIAQGYAESGIANLVLCSRKKEACEDTAAQLREQYGVNVLALSCDVTDAASVRDVVEQTVAQFGRVDIVVNNSGASWGAPFLKMPQEAWQKVVDTNLTGTFLMSQAAATVMAEHESGVILNIASIAGFGGTPPFMETVGYNASKAGVIAMTKDLAVKLGKHNIRVNAIAPGFFPTKMANGLIEIGKDYIEDHTPLGRLGGEQDLKGAAIFLASPAASYITGAILPVDGGMSTY